MTDKNETVVSEMTDKTLSLADLRAVEWSHDKLPPRVRPATRSDLEAVVKSLGGEEIEAIQTNMGINPIDRPWVSKPGRFLILRLDDPIEEG